MNLLDVILELIKTFTMVSSDKFKQLKKDCEDWEETATPDNENSIKSAYGKAHKGIWLRVATPFLFWYLRNEFTQSNTQEEDPFKD